MSLRRNESGQAVAEFAAAIPIVMFFMVLLIELGLVMVDQLALERVAREAARVAAVSDSGDEVRKAAEAATDLPRDRLQVRIGQRPAADGLVQVEVTYESRVVAPFTGTVLFRPQLHASASMRVEDVAVRVPGLQPRRSLV
jgi:Flp pilus assembly protein TadG